ncbi:leptin receptor isoform X3 [Dunckerocampus dactyliophorus]|uniref:leptin receptor isoform X3 n=1 Tax=Dunckerocampus dactyliophorus TaxID=161453 RepID=UPI0024053BDA|nr:leptin receptor isoform X3 [Dunckerocampus dactyliophorus]
MGQSVMLSFFVHVFLVSTGILCLEPQEGAGLSAGALDLPWQDQLCCDSPSAQEGEEDGTPETNRSVSNLPHHPRCYLKSKATGSSPYKASGGTCLDMLCRIDENWKTLTCDLGSPRTPSGTLNAAPVAVSLRRLLFQKNDDQVNKMTMESYKPVVCEAKDSCICSIPLDTMSFVTMVTVNISGADAEPFLLNVPARPVKPRPPVNLSHFQTIEPDLILQWDEPKDDGSGPLRYEVRYSDVTHPSWQVISTGQKRKLSLDLKPKVTYTMQIHCSGLHDPPLWSNWSEPYDIYLDTVSYIPEKVLAHPGENVSIYCVFNDHSINASSAVWMLNFKQSLHPSQYHTVNQWVSQITVRPSDSGLYDLLQCTATKEWAIPYSLIYIEGASVDISCETSGDIDAMDCSWQNTLWLKLTFESRWADLPCDEMEDREKKGERVGEMGPKCLPVRSKPQACSIQPIRMTCYKLWLEVLSHQGPVRSKPIYISPIDHVKPHAPTNVKAVSLRSGVLRITWEPPSLPVQELLYQFRLHSPSTIIAQQEWKVYNPVQVPWAEVTVLDMCRVYVVQVRCIPTNHTGHWSDWSDSVYSIPQNSRAPENGPDFWRILQDDPLTNRTNVTLLFKHLPTTGLSYCINGFIVQHHTANGILKSKKTEIASSYSFEWDREVQTVTVEAFNSLGASRNNINMTLERRPKRYCVRSFHVLFINSSCVSMRWSLLDSSSAPLFMVVQWAPQGEEESDSNKVHIGHAWTRLPFTDRPIYLKGDFYSTKDYGFYLYPVLPDGEGEPAFAVATRGDPATYMTMLIIVVLSIILFVTLVLSQNQMKRFVWKDVPNPKKCSWAKGLNFKKADTFEQLFQVSDALPAWPLLLPSENISTVVIMDKTDLSALSTSLVRNPLMPPTPDLVSRPSFLDQSRPVGNEVLVGDRRPSSPDLDLLNSRGPRIDESQLMDPSQGIRESSAQSSVAYATVLLTDPKQEEQCIHDQDQDGSSSSSSDEGNFSANNSDISGSFPGGLWELESCHGGELDDPRRSCSYNSVEELSETSDQEDDATERKDLYYLGMDYPAEDEESDGETTQKEELLKHVIFNRDVDSELISASSCVFPPLYLPQFRTAADTRKLPD